MWCEMITELEPSLYELVSQLEKMKWPHLCDIQIGWESWIWKSQLKTPQL